MSQPIWKLVANLGDVNPVQSGAFLVYVDTTGVYGPEAELYEPNEDEETGGTVSRFMLETGANEWFMDKLSDVAATCWQSADEYRTDLSSGDPIRIASVYRDLVGYFGPFEFDQYPLDLTEAEAEARYSKDKLSIA
jgi:hypothetical protein